MGATTRGYIAGPSGGSNRAWSSGVADVVDGLAPECRPGWTGSRQKQTGRRKSGQAVVVSAGAEVGNTDAQHNLGLLLKERGEVGEAETWWRRAAEAGDTDAQHNLGLLLDGRGEVGEAESWYRRAAEAGDTGAQTNLGVLLKERGEVGDGESGRDN